MYSEKERVPLFKQVCDSSASAAEKTQQLARLMNDSQDSCRCRTPALQMGGSVLQATLHYLLSLALWHLIPASQSWHWRCMQGPAQVCCEGLITPDEAG